MDERVLWSTILRRLRGTLCEAARLLKKQGASRVIAAVTHCLLGEKGSARLKESPIEEMIVTDSVPLREKWDYPITVLTVAELLGEAIIRIHEGRSVSSLFKL